MFIDPHLVPRKPLRLCKDNIYIYIGHGRLVAISFRTPQHTDSEYFKLKA